MKSALRRKVAKMWKRIFGFVAVAVVVWIATGYFSAQSACAHDPRFACSARGKAHPIRIPDAAKSWAYYGTLRPGASDRYEFKLPVQTVVPMNLLVDARDAGNLSRPSLSIQRGGRELVRFSFSHSDIFYEPFSRESYIQTPERKPSLPAGHYVAIVSMNGRDPQRYTFAIGKAERFTVFQIPYVLGAVHRIRALQY